MKQPTLKDEPGQSVESDELRRLAEARLSQQPPAADPARREADTQRLMHELQVHQIELELQNVELRHTKDELEAQLEKYSDLYDFAPVGYLTLDREGLICDANLTCASLLGLPRSRLVGSSFGLCVSAEGQATFRTCLRRVFETKTREVCELPLLKPGKPGFVARLEALATASGGVCRAVVTDITEQKRAEADRLILSKLESTGILAGGIAHDFNNLLATILLSLDLARETAGSGESLARSLADATRAAMQARGLTQQLITFARGGAPVRKPIRLDGVLRESTRLALSGSRVRCEFCLAEDLRLVEADEGQLGQVIRNLVLNAREAMPQGGTMSIRAENLPLDAHDIRTLPPGEYVRISVTDPGAGIARELVPRIFDAYFSTKTRGEQKGMGLGLTICHAIMQKHDGAITVESEEGKGTTFRLYLPAVRAAFPKENPLARPVRSRPGHILVMEDEDGLRQVLGFLLRRMGHEVTLVADGWKAVAAFASAQELGHPYEAVILDLTVQGGMGGVEAVQALLELDPALKAVVMSGYANDPVLLDPAQYGFKAGLTKPFDQGQLEAVCSRLLGSRNDSAGPGTP
jgi:PAS domain S-box-containing protein